MKSYYHTLSRSEIARAAQEAARKEVDAMRDELYAKVERDCTYQALATAFAVLHREFGFGQHRLTRLKNEIEREYVMMQNGVLGRDYSPRDAQAWLKERYGIDFEESQFKE